MPDDQPTPLARLTRRAKQAAAALKDEYAAGARGDTEPAAPIWATPGEQLDAVVKLLRSATTAIEAPAPADDATSDDRADDPAADRSTAAAAQMSLAIRSVDWGRVREATTDRTADVSRTARQLAEQVDWARIQPRAAQVSRAVIAAVASGQLGVGGRLGAVVARTIVDQGGLADQVGELLDHEPEELRRDIGRAVIDTSATEA